MPLTTYEVLHSQYSVSQIKRIIYLKEIFLLALTAFGGPGAHFSLIQRNLVEKRKYLSTAELLELHSFCSMLPGPTSTQMIICIGFKLGGPFLSILSLFIWALPACTVMALFALSWTHVEKSHALSASLHYIQPMAVGFITAAAIKVVPMLKRTSISLILYFVGALCAIIFHSPWVFPVLIVFGGLVSHIFNREDYPPFKPLIHVRWRNAIWLVAILIISAVVGNISRSKPVLLFENTYQYGCIVFGGGNVLIPMMFKQYVTFKNYMVPEDFITGVGLVQAMPGPVFSVSTYANAMALQELGNSGLILGAVIGTVGIFLPGILIVFFLFPLWTQIKQHPIIRKAIDGITAVSAGLILAAAYLLFRTLPYEGTSLVVMCITTLLVLFTRLPSPIIVIMTLLAGFIQYG